jgi:uncharacterized membrane protein YedE/YeeE
MKAAFLGAVLGFSLSRIGFTSYDELHRMFVFDDLRLVLVFAVAVALCAIGFRLVPGGRAIPPRAIDRSVVTGGVLFGLGWVLCGACPGAAFAQLGEGKLYALVTLAGIGLGTLAHRPINARVLKWEAASCG